MLYAETAKHRLRHQRTASASLEKAFCWILTFGSCKQRAEKKSQSRAKPTRSADFQSARGSPDPRFFSCYLEFITVGMIRDFKLRPMVSMRLFGIIMVAGIFVAWGW